MNLIQIYTPTADKDNDAIQFYAQLRNALQAPKRIMLGDFNAEIVMK
jgi:hypothetical protein